jgi:hypothetical protein
MVADPFLAKIGSGWQMFVEVQQQRGEVGLATSTNGLDWTYQGIVLSEPFHLSYPQVFEWQDEVYMVPESYQANAVRLYRADPYPTRWLYLGDILTGAAYSDATLLRRGDRWWLWVQIPDVRALRDPAPPSSTFASVHLFWSDALTGPWVSHPLNPVVQGDPRRARPAGRPVEYGGRTLRFSQDCVPTYGSAVRVMEVVTLTPEDYEERELPQSPLLAGTGVGWNAEGMHHIDLHRVEDGSWIAAVDGWTMTEGQARALAR